MLDPYCVVFGSVCFMMGMTCAMSAVAELVFISNTIDIVTAQKVERIQKWNNEI